MIKLLPKFLNYTILLLTIILPFSSALGNILLIILIILSILDLILNKKKLYYNSALVFFIATLIFSLINNTFQGSLEANKSFWKFFPFVGIGLLSITQLEKKEFNYFKKASIISCFIYIIISLIKTIIFYNQYQYLPFGNDYQINEILSIHRPYLGFYVLINILFCFKILIDSKKKLYGILGVVFILYLILILARLSILTLVITLIIYVCFYSKTRLKTKILILFGSILGIGSLTLINPNITERMNYETYEKFVDFEPRFVIWKSILNIKNNEDYNPLIGYGNANLIEEYLVINYDSEIQKEDKRNYYLKERFNTHSQFFDFLLMGGYPLLITFCLFFIGLLYHVRKDALSTLIVISFILFFSVENLFVRQLGCFLFVIYLGYIIVRNKSYKASN